MRCAYPVHWWYHVAPVIKVRTKNNELIEMVIDPSMTQEPVTISQWTGMMSTKSFQRLSGEQVKQQLQENQGHFEDNQRILFTASRYAYNPIDLNSPTEATANAHLKDEINKISQYAQRSQAHKIVALIRQELRSNNINVNRIVATIKNASPYERDVIRDIFPRLLAELKKRITAPDMTRIEEALIVTEEYY